MSRTVETAQLTADACTACGRTDNVVIFLADERRSRGAVILCAVCLASVIDKALGTNYRLTVQVGLATRSAVQRIPKEKKALAR